MSHEGVACLRQDSGHTAQLWGDNDAPTPHRLGHRAQAFAPRSNVLKVRQIFSSVGKDLGPTGRRTQGSRLWKGLELAFVSNGLEAGKHVTHST